MLVGLTIAGGGGLYFLDRGGFKVRWILWAPLLFRTCFDIK